MRPEPGNRITRAEKRKAWNETPPVCIRIASHPVKEELDARSDGTLAGYRQVILRDLSRYYQLLSGHQRKLAPLQVYDMPDWIDMLHEGFAIDKIVEAITTNDDYTISYTQAVAIVDALERAKILTDAGLSLDEALVSVGLVKGETE